MHILKDFFAFHKIQCLNDSNLLRFKAVIEFQSLIFSPGHFDQSAIKAKIFIDAQSVTVSGTALKVDNLLIQLLTFKYSFPLPLTNARLIRLYIHVYQTKREGRRNINIGSVSSRIIIAEQRDCGGERSWERILRR